MSDSSTFFINKIIITGNEKTKEEVIRREMKTEENKILDLEILKEDVSRIYNLGLFTKIDVLNYPIEGNKINLIINVEESFYFLPFPQIGIKESDFKKVWVGMNFLWRNISGWNQTVGASFAVGYEPFVNLYYFNPWIGKKEHFFGSVDFKYSKTVNKNSYLPDSSGNIINKSEIPDFDNISMQADVLLGKYLTKNFSVSLDLAYNNIKVSDYRPDRTVSTTGTDRFLSLCLTLNKEKRDNIFFSTTGSYYNVKYIRHNSFNNEIGFNKVKLDLRKFIPLKIKNDYDITLAIHNITGISFGGPVPRYMYEVFGYDNIIRGWNGKVIEGENLIGFNNEIRIPLIKPFYVKGTDHPFFNKIKQLRNNSFQYGLFLSMFYDIGGVWQGNRNITKTEYKSGYGLGLNFIFPFNVVGRVDWGFRRENSKYLGQIYFALNSSF